MQNSLVVKNISKSYNKKPVLRDINCHFEQGEAVGIFGPNGAGKTTLFSIIIGLVKCDLGELELNNQNITNLPMYLRSRLGIGYLPQESSIFRGLSVEDNIKAILEINYTNKEKIEEKCSSLMQEFSIEHLKNSMSTTLSGGERRRLEIARALATNPKFILLDEPLAGIDPIAVRDIKELVAKLTQKNIGVIITDHNVRDTLDIIDRAYIVFDGNILKEGTPKEIADCTEVREVYLGNSFLDS